MDLAKIRKKTGLNRKQFVAKLRPSLNKRRTVFTENMLVRIENGETVSDDRIKAISESIKEVFPEFSDKSISVRKKGISIELSANLVALIGFVILSVAASAFYFFTSEKKLVVEMLTIIASVAGVIGLIYAVRKVSS